MAVLFDLDGTLIGASKSKSGIMKECARELGLPEITRAEYHEAFEQVIRDAKIDTRVPVFERIVGDRELAEELAERYRTRSLESSIIYPDAEEVLQKLSVRKGILTNGPRLVQWEKIRKFDLDKYVESVVISGEIGKSKPGREIFDFALKSLGLAPDEAVYVGDTPHHDVMGARNAGLVSILINRSDDPEGPEPDYEINDLRELYGIVGETEPQVNE